MCRLFGQISPKNASAFDLLVESDWSLLKQSDHNRNHLQKDGWGVASFGKNGAKVVKSPNAIYAEKKRFAKASRVQSRAVIGHIRAASNPLGLSKKKLINQVNSQPFTDGKIAFAHNGTLQIPTEIAERLGPYKKRIKGVNDSEVYFWQFRKFLDQYGNVPDALKACVREIWSVWKIVSKKYPNKKTPYTGLNTLVSDGTSLHAMCHYPYGAKGAVSIFEPGCPWGRMNLTRRGDRMIFASEPVDKGAWKRFDEPEIISARIAGGKIKMSRQSFYPKGKS